MTNNNTTTNQARFVIDKMSDIDHCISIQGNIGSGKSSLLSYMEQFTNENELSPILKSEPFYVNDDDNHINNGVYSTFEKKRDDNKGKDYFIFVNEPVDEWKKVIYSTSFYKDQSVKETEIPNDNNNDDYIFSSYYTSIFVYLLAYIWISFFSWLVIRYIDNTILNHLLMFLIIICFSYDIDKIYNKKRKMDIIKKESEKISMLDFFYKDMSKNGFIFQVHAFTTRLQMIINQINKINIKREPGDKIHLITERSLRTDQLFFENLYTSKLIPKIQLDVYNSFFNLICDEIIKKETIMIYLKTPPIKCHNRINKRERKEELDGICPDYLISLDKAHDIMINDFENENKKVIRIDFEKDLDTDGFKALTKKLMNDLLTEINK
jgi:deoxyadenosine/deoxycytidine kinase